MRFFPHILLIGYAIFWAVLAIDPVDRTVWWAENIPVILAAAGLTLTFGKFRFSNLAYGLMACWIFWHTVGGHYTFAGVPFDFVTDLFGFERNHFDRVGHYVIGFWAFPAAEFLSRRNLATRPVIYLFSLFAVMALAAGYEIIEWWYAVLEGGNAGVEFLGSQGDVWDAQKDMLADTLGALTSLLIFRFTLDPGPGRFPAGKTA